MSTATQVISPDTTLDILDLRVRRRDAVLSQLVQDAVEHGAVRDPEMLIALLQRHERLAPASIGKGVALPHAHSMTVLHPAVLCGRSPRGIDWAPDDEEPVTLTLLVLSPVEWSGDHHYQWVSQVAHAVRLQRTRQRLLESDPLMAADVLRGALT